MLIQSNKQFLNLSYVKIIFFIKFRTLKLNSINFKQSFNISNNSIYFTILTEISLIRLFSTLFSKI